MQAKRTMNHQTLIFLFSLSLLINFFSCTQDTTPINDPDQEVWISLVDSTGLQNWTPKFAGYKAGENYRNRFVYQDGLLGVRYEVQDSFKAKFGHLFYKDKYSYYRLKATYRFVNQQMTDGPAWAFRNNGLMLHCQSAQSMTMEQDFPISLEMQLLGGNGTDERSTGNLCSPGTHVIMHDTLFTPHCVNSTSKTYHGDQWVNVEALVLGDSLIRHIVEGSTVLEYSKPTVGGGYANGHDTIRFVEGTPITEGYISIQAETHPIDFKSIDLLNLCGCMDKKAKNYKSYYIKADNSTCVY